MHHPSSDRLRKMDMKNRKSFNINKCSNVYNKLPKIHLVNLVLIYFPLPTTQVATKVSGSTASTTATTVMIASQPALQQGQVVQLPISELGKF